VGRESLVGIATRFGLFVPGIRSRRGRYFPHPPRLTLDPPSVLYNGYRVSLLGEVRPGRDVDHAPPSSAEVKETVEQYVCSPLGLHGLLKVELYLLQ